MKQFTQEESAFKKQTAFMILENKIENLTNEYLFFECLTENERVPSKAFGTLWKTITENLPALKKDMTNRSLFVKNDGVYLKQAYKIKEARRKYIFDKIIFFILPPLARANPYYIFRFPIISYLQKRKRGHQSHRPPIREIFSYKKQTRPRRCPERQKVKYASVLFRFYLDSFGEHFKPNLAQGIKNGR